MKKSIFTVITAMMILSSSCAYEPQMDRTVFIPDVTYSNLPAYTEWGYNSFGAIYDNRTYFLVSNNVVPCKIMYRDGLLRFLLSGVLKAESYGSDRDQLTLTFIFPEEDIVQYSDLLTFNDKQINLTDKNCEVKISRGEGGNERTLEIVGGILHFKRAQQIYIDEALNRVILSGVFELRFLENEFPITISDGRFDVGINENVFYAY